jgi:phosphoglycolate phosphatase-like HAD superfamily hydrolase
MSLTIEGVHAIVFDADNTLFTCASNDEAILAILRRYGCSVPAPELTETISAANSDWAIIERCLPADVHESAYAEVLTQNAVLAAQSDFDQALRECLAALAGRYPLFVLSGRDRSSIDVALRQHHIDHLFRDVVGAGIDGVEKPDPRDMLALLSRHAIAPAAAIYVGDKRVDRELAEAAGTRFVCAAWYEDLLPEADAKATTVSAFWALFR